ncbi:MAG: ATP-grasp domain-containing protein [Nitrospinae bacterium]|nr:ATP-grasp domain-containing protein [Nitrospinota bacterium]
MESPSTKDPLLLIGVDVRSLARNAILHRRDFVLADRFGDASLARRGECHTLGRAYGGESLTRGLADLVRGRHAEGVIYGAGFENDVLTLSRLGEVGPLLGCSLETVRKTRDPESLIRASRAWSFTYPDIRYKRQDLDTDSRWLTKPFAGLFGDGIRFADAEEGLRPGVFYQRHVPGFSSSALVVSDGSEAFLLGVVANIAADPVYGAEGFQYVGGIYPHPFAAEMGAAVTNMADALTLEFDIRGLWGFDFIYHGGVTLVMVEPRPPVGLELINMATWNDLLGMHTDALTSKSSNHIIDPGPAGTSYGFARVRAAEELIFSHGERWAERGALDLPADGESVRAGQHLATLTARGKSYSVVRDDLRQQALLLSRELGVAVASSR